MIPTPDEKTAIQTATASQAKRYARARLRIGLVKLGLSAAFLLAFLLSGASERLRDAFGKLTGNYYLQLSGYLLAFMAIYTLVLLGFDFYSDVALERRYGLSNQTVRGWLARSAKQWLLSAALFVPGLDLLYCLIRATPDWWWLFASAGWLAFSVLVGKIAPALIVPLFYKLRPLTDRDLAERLRALADRCGLPTERIFEIGLSKETKKANAAVVGLGRQRRILIGDTLLDLCTHEEIEAVFAHELGHTALHHGWKLLGGAAGVTTIGLYLLHLVLGPSAVALGLAGADDVAAVPLLLLWLMAFGLIVRPAQAGYSRRLEKQADLFILGRVEKPESLIAALAKLAQRNLADLQPSRLVELLFYDHPPIAKRIEYLQRPSRR
jgi:STE24 endopeptidase